MKQCKNHFFLSLLIALLLLLSGCSTSFGKKSNTIVWSDSSIAFVQNFLLESEPSFIENYIISSNPSDINNFSKKYELFLAELDYCKDLHKSFIELYADDLSHYPDLKYMTAKMTCYDDFISLIDTHVLPAYKNKLNGKSDLLSYFEAINDNNSYYELIDAWDSARSAYVAVFVKYQVFTDPVFKALSSGTEKFLTNYFSDENYSYTCLLDTIDEFNCSFFHHLHSTSDLNKWSFGTDKMSLMKINASSKQHELVFYIPISAYYERGCDYIYGYNETTIFFDILGQISTGSSFIIAKDAVDTTESSSINDTQNNKTSTSHTDICSCDFAGDYFNDYVHFGINENNDSYEFWYMEERHIEVDGILETSQFDVHSSNYVLECTEQSCTITFTISGYSTDYNGTLTLRCSQTSDGSKSYAVCINMPALLETHALFVPIEKVGNDQSTNIYDALLSGKMTFVDFDTKTEATIFTIPEINSSYLGSPRMYTIVDLDGNGIDELLVQYDFMGDTAILNVEDDQITAYYVPYRGIEGLKTDGTMCGSDSASEGSIHRIIFTYYGIDYHNIVTYDTGEISGTEKYTFNGIVTDKNTYLAQLELQNSKADVSWMVINN